ncbi:MAG: glycosyltransferase family 8 protein [Megamonas funiformis]|uniref:glycosyltransferase family 8 protein n=1 Tax=Megamonas funiformis TaxID=437897 RepID=UPI00399322C2
MEDKELNRFKELVEFYDTDIIIYEIDNSEFLNLDDREFTIATYYRFAIPYQLKDLTDKYLYIDADMIAIRDLKDYLNINIENKIAAVVDDFTLDKVGNPILLAEDKKYFNAGMMYINLNLWMKEQVSEKSVSILREVNLDPKQKIKYGYEFRCFDQDALNIVLKNKVKYIEPKYNFLANISLKHNKNLQNVPTDTIFIHYHGFNKPWHEWCFHHLARYFRDYKEISPWKNEPWDKCPTKYRQMRLYAKFYIKNGNFIKAMYWIIRSILKKYKK